MPEVSVIIVARNREKFIKTAIQSALGQTLKDIEIIVVDDGSTDSTFEIARSFDDVRAYRIKPSGISWARNYAAQKAKSDWLAFLDSDDKWLPEKLEIQLKLLKESGLAFSATDAFLVDEKGERFALLSERQRPYDGYVFFNLVRSNFICTPTVVIHKYVFWQKGGFDTRMISAEDYHLWLRVSYTHPLLYVDIPLVEYRDHPYDRMQRRQLEIIDWTIKALNDVVNTFELDKNRFEFKRRLAELNYYAAVWHLAKLQPNLARKHLLEAFSSSPLKVKKAKSLMLLLKTFFLKASSLRARNYIMKHKNLWQWRR